MYQLSEKFNLQFLAHELMSIHFNQFFIIVCSVFLWISDSVLVIYVGKCSINKKKKKMQWHLTRKTCILSNLFASNSLAVAAIMVAKKNRKTWLFATYTIPTLHFLFLIISIFYGTSPPTICATTSKLWIFVFYPPIYLLLSNHWRLSASLSTTFFFFVLLFFSSILSF